jgi:hypothetical protein
VTVASDLHDLLLAARYGRVEEVGADEFTIRRDAGSEPDASAAAEAAIGRGLIEPTYPAASPPSSGFGFYRLTGKGYAALAAMTRPRE